MPIQADEVLRIARLAHLELDRASATRVTGQLQAILDHVALLEGIDLEDVPATTSASLASAPLREDEPVPSLPVEEALANAPDAATGFFRVPQVLAE